MTSIWDDIDDDVLEEISDKRLVFDGELETIPIWYHMIFKLSNQMSKMCMMKSEDNEM